MTKRPAIDKVALMKRIFALALTIFSMTTPALASTSTGVHPEAVTGFDVNRYLGDWYEIGTVPQWFQRDCVCTRARYSMGASERINVLNECRKKTLDGRIDRARGKARFATDRKDIGDLEVSFFLWFYGSYRIIELDPDYRYSVVSNDEGTTFWILSRTPTMDPELIEQIKSRAVEKGLDLSAFRLTPQEGCRALDAQ